MNPYNDPSDLQLLEYILESLWRPGTLTKLQVSMLVCLPCRGTWGGNLLEVQRHTVRLRHGVNLLRPFLPNGMCCVIDRGPWGWPTWRIGLILGPTTWAGPLDRRSFYSRATELRGARTWIQVLADEHFSALGIIPTCVNSVL